MDQNPSEEPLEKRLIVSNPVGIHARPAAMIVKIANRYPKVKLNIYREDQKVSGKSIMGIMLLAANKGTELRFVAVGEQSNELLEEIEVLFKKQFKL